MSATCRTHRGAGVRHEAADASRRARSRSEHKSATKHDGVRQAAFVFLRAGLYNIHSSGTIANVQGEPAAHALRGAVQRAREQGRGRRGKRVLGDPVEQVLRGPEGGRRWPNVDGHGVMPFVIAQFLIMFLMVFFPWLVTAPAKLFHGGP